MILHKHIAHAAAAAFYVRDSASGCLRPLLISIQGLWNGGWRSVCQWLHLAVLRQWGRMPAITSGKFGSTIVTMSLRGIGQSPSLLEMLVMSLVY